MAPELIYCADGNRRFAEIAIATGFLYGARLPARGLPYSPWFADQDWKKPDRARYMAELERHRPHMATVLDLELIDQLEEVLSWAEEAAQYVAVVLVIPKAQGIIDHLPRRIGTAEVRLAYSVPTRYGGTSVPLWDFYDWPVHLLGGSPHKQMELACYLDVRSVDGNYHGMMARRYCEYWRAGGWHEMGGAQQRDDMYEAFRISCKNIRAAWHNAT